jgi:hypothetical protein
VVPIKHLERLSRNGHGRYVPVVSRVELELAIGRVLTSARHAHDLRHDPEGFAQESLTDPDEQASLIRMSADLMGLMPGFVGKRQNLLSRTARRTLGLLGHPGHHWVEEFTEQVPPVEVKQSDPGRWLDWLAQRVRAEAAAGRLDHAGVIADMVRLETQFYRAFRTAGDPGETQVGLLRRGAPISLHPSADLIHLDWDVVNLSDPSPADLPRVKRAPVDLLVYRSRRGRVVTESIIESDLLDALLELASGPMTVRALVSMADHEPSLQAHIRRLYRWGALTQ